MNEGFVEVKFHRSVFSDDCESKLSMTGRLVGDSMFIDLANGAKLRKKEGQN